MTTIINGSSPSITFSDSTTQTTAFNTSSAVTSVVAGTNMTVSGATGAVTISASAYPLTSGTAVASTSGTSITFTGIPSWAKRITVMLLSVSTNGGANPQLRLGTSGGIVSSGYVGSESTIVGTNAGSYTKSISTGFDAVYDYGGSTTYSGQYIVSLISSNNWVATWNLGATNTGRMQVGSGSLNLGGTLTQVQFTTSNGTDSFNAGSINIFYE